MVGHFSFRLAIFLIALATSFQAHSRAILKVTILESGATMDTDKRIKNECRAFKPTVRQVKRYFERAYSAPRYYGGHDRYSPCYAAGTIVFDDFGKAELTITSGGAGSLIWSDEDIARVFYKDNGWFDPTACTYGHGSEEGEC